MWIIITGLVLTSPLILYYLINDSSSIIIDKKNFKIIIPDKSPPTVIRFADLIKVDLIITGTKPTIANVKAKSELSEANSVCLKITSTNTENPVLVYFIEETNQDNVDLKNATKRARILHNKLSEIINSNSQAKSINRNNTAEFQIKNLSEFRTKIIRQSATHS